MKLEPCGDGYECPDCGFIPLVGEYQRNGKTYPIEIDFRQTHTDVECRLDWTSLYWCDTCQCEYEVSDSN